VIIKKSLFISIGLILTSFQSYANLLISPTRINFDERQRVAKVIIINDSKEYKTYRLEWQEKISKATGGYTNFKSGQKNPTSLSQMTRVSPSQVRLSPGERQIVKLAIRKPKGLDDNEYRSHLTFKALPDKNKLDEKLGIGINLNLLLSYSIPVILRQGAKLPEVEIKSIELISGKDKKSLLLAMPKSGNYSSFGKLEVFYTPSNSSKEIKVAMLGDYSIYSEVSEAKLNLNFFENIEITKPGKLRVVYTGSKEYQGTIFAEKSVSIDANSIGQLR